MRKFRRSSRSSKPRLIALIAALVIALLWAQSEMMPRWGGRAGVSRGSGSGTAVAATTPNAAPAPADQATPEGWGADPFDPRPFGPTPVTTGR